VTSSKQRRQGLKPPPKIHAGEPAPASGAETEFEAPAQPEAFGEPAVSEGQEEGLPATSEQASGEAASEPMLSATSESPGEAAASEPMLFATSESTLSPGEAAASEPMLSASAQASEAARPDAPGEAAVSEGQEASVRSSGEGGLAADGPREDLAANEIEDDDEEPRRVASGVMLSEEIPIDPEDDLRSVEGEASPRLVSIIESLLFSASKPLSVRDLRKVLQETSQHQIQLALRHLLEVTKTRGVMLAQVAGGFQLRTHPDNAVWVQKMLQAKPTRLSRTQIETLAIVAYRQPVTRPEIDDIRGVDSGAVLRSLLERELVQIVGKKDEPGRPLLYGTTVRFLEFFNLRGLRDLPTLRDFRDLSEESKATLRERLGDLQIAEALGQGVLGFPGEEGSEAGATLAEDPPDASSEASEPSVGTEVGEAAEPGDEPAVRGPLEGAEREIEAREEGAGAEAEAQPEDGRGIEAGAEREAEDGREAEAGVEGEGEAQPEDGRGVEVAPEPAEEPGVETGAPPELAEEPGVKAGAWREGEAQPEDEGSVAEDDAESGAVLPGTPERAPAEGDPPEES